MVLQDVGHIPAKSAYACPLDGKCLAARHDLKWQAGDNRHHAIAVCTNELTKQGSAIAQSATLPCKDLAMACTAYQALSRAITTTVLPPESPARLLNVWQQIKKPEPWLTTTMTVRPEQQYVINSSSAHTTHIGRQAGRQAQVPDKHHLLILVWRQLTTT